MWKDFFYFTKTERTGFYVLVGLIGVAFLIYWVFPVSNLSTKVSEQIDETTYKKFLASVHQRDKSWNFRDYYIHKKQEIILAPFDPNTADSITFVHLGIRPYIARNILHYRAKGGKFRTPESFAKVYGLSPEQFKLLKPYITIGDNYLKKADSLRQFMIKLIGGNPIDWAFKTECCGAGFSVSRTDLVAKLSGNILQDAADRNAEAIIVACPMCQSNLDMRRGAINETLSKPSDIPVIFITQAIGLALGVSPKELGLERHFVNVKM